MCKSITKREEWFNTALPLLDDLVFNPVGYKIPDNVQVGVGSMSKTGREKYIGMCWSEEASHDSTIQIFINPHLGDAVKVLDILCHECVHAIDGNKNGHKAPFRKIATAIGLEGKMTATVAGERLNAVLTEIVEKIGEYPHAGMLENPSKKKQGTRMLKVSCSDCDWSFRTSSKNVEMMVSRECLSCGEHSLKLPNEEPEES